MRSNFFIILFAGLASLVNAQYVRRYPFHPGWYIGANAGTNYYVAEGYQTYPVSDALGGNAKISMGYHFNPIIGVRASIGFGSHNWPDKNNNFIKTSFTDQNLTGDLTVNLTNACLGYKTNRLLYLTVFGGGGAGRRDKAVFPTAIISYLIHGGLQLDYRLSPWLTLNLITEGNVVSDSYNNLVEGDKLDAFQSLSVGLNYQIPSSKRILHGHRYNYQSTVKKSRKKINIVIQ